MRKSGKHVDADPEDFVEEYLEGFPDCAALIASSDDLALFRSFKELSTRNLLYMQLELAALQGEIESLDRLDKDDITAATANGDTAKLATHLLTAKSWEMFSEKAKEPKSRAARKMHLVMEIRRAVREYHKAMTRHSAVLTLQGPGRVANQTFKSWFDEKGPFEGYGSRIDEADDLKWLQTNGVSDKFPQLLRNWNLLGPLIKEKRRIPQSWGQMSYFRQGPAFKAVTFITIIVSTAFLIGAVAWLANVERTGVKLAIISCPTVAFAVSVVLLMNRKRSEIFASTAVYVAILVVFMGRQ